MVQQRDMMPHLRCVAQHVDQRPRTLPPARQLQPQLAPSPTGSCNLPVKSVYNLFLRANFTWEIQFCFGINFFLLPRNTRAMQDRSLIPQLIKRVLIVDVVARESLQAASWICYMLRLVPFSPSVYVAGSVGTWLAEYDIHRTRPLWDPNDIDVFMMVHSPLEYHALCDKFVASFATSPTIRIAVQRKFNHILNVLWWVTVDGAEIECPEFSLIHVPSILLSTTLVQQFDINICKVAVNIWAGQLSMELSANVYSAIRHRGICAVLRQDPSSSSFHYPMQKTMTRVRKYIERGYIFKSLQFAPTHGTLDVADFENIWQRVQQSDSLKLP
jgi:hypothetical protein